MIAALRLHTRVHVGCLRRNRLIHAFAILVAAGLALAIVPGLTVADTSDRFQSLQMLARLLHGVVSSVTAILGLFLLWTHRRSRAITMVATTPAPFGAWVASLFLTSALIAAAAHVIVVVVVMTLSQAWGVTYQYGFLYLAIDRWAESLIALGVVTTLGAVMHPVITVVLMSMISDATVMVVRQGLDLAPGLLASAAQALAAGFYYVLPAYDPYGERTEALLRTMRPATSDWRHLGVTVGYALLVLAFAQVTTLVLLRRKPVA